MKARYTNLKATKILLLSISSLLLFSCGTYQSVSNDDGIYDDERPVKEENRVIIANQKEYKQYNDNYFTKELERLESVDNNDIFTDVDDYRSDSLDINEEEFDDRISNGAWGYNDNNDVVVHINLNTSPYWNDFYGAGFNNWGWGWNDWRWNRLRWNAPWWGVNPYWHPYHNNLAWGWGWNNWGWNNGFYGYNRPYYRGYRYGHFNNFRNYRYGRRTAYNNTYRRSNATTRRAVTSRRSASTTRRSNTIRRNPRATSSNTRIRRNTKTTPRRNTRVRGTNSTPRRSTRTRSTTPRRSSSSTRRSTSTRSNRSSTPRTRSTSTRRSISTRSNRSSTPSRSSYTPSRSSSSNRSSRASSSRSSSSRGSSSRGSSRRR